MKISKRYLYRLWKLAFDAGKICSDGTTQAEERQLYLHHMEQFFSSLREDDAPSYVVDMVRAEIKATQRSS